MKIKIITICLLFVTIFLSCKKEDLSSGITPANTYVPKLSKLLTDNLSSDEFVYNDSGMVKQANSKYEATINHYNAKGQLVTTEYYSNDDILSSDQSVSETAMNLTSWVTPETGKKGGILTYEYNENGQLVKATSTHPSLSCSEYSMFTYDSNNRITKQTTYWENVATGYIDYTYDTKGNLTSESLYSLPATGDATLITTTKYTFDTEPNPFKSRNGLLAPGINTNVNNVLKETYTLHLTTDQGSDKTEVTENTYSYNSLGYPISKNGNITYVYE
jgi:hypothetical protein